MIHFMSVLGTSNYSECRYVWQPASNSFSADGFSPDEYSYVGRFVQLASLKKVLQENPGQSIKISIFLTQKARDENWESRKKNIAVELDEELDAFREAYEESHKDVKVRIALSMQQQQDGLKKELEDFRASYEEKYTGAQIEICDVDIPDGASQDEQDMIVQKMYDQIGMKEVIVFDLTHGFRSIPILAMTILNYARITKRIQVRGLYYGAFEAKHNNGSVPIFDMTYCDNMMQWASAADSFICTGRSEQIKRIIDDKDKVGINVSDQARKALNSLYDLTNCLETSRGQDVEDGVSQKTQKSIRSAHGMFVLKFNNMTSAHKRGSAAEEAVLQGLLGSIKQDVSVFDGKVRPKNTGRDGRLNETSIGISAVRWAISKNLTQQGLTALEATIITFVSEMCGFNSDRQLKLIADIKTYPGRQCLSDALLRKNLQDLNVQQVSSTIHNKFHADDLKKLGKCCKEVKSARNSINHFGLTDSSSGYTYDGLNKILRAQFNIFLECVDSDCVCTDGNQNILNWKVTE